MSHMLIWLGRDTGTCIRLNVRDGLRMAVHDYDVRLFDRDQVLQFELNTWPHLPDVRVIPACTTPQRDDSTGLSEQQQTESNRNKYNAVLDELEEIQDWNASFKEGYSVCSDEEEEEEEGEEEAAQQV